MCTITHNRRRRGSTGRSKRHETSSQTCGTMASYDSKKCHTPCSKLSLHGLSNSPLSLTPFSCPRTSSDSRKCLQLRPLLVSLHHLHRYHPLGLKDQVTVPVTNAAPSCVSFAVVAVLRFRAQLLRCPCAQAHCLAVSLRSFRL